MQLQSRVAASYATYFAYVDAVNMESGPAKAGHYEREERLKIIAELEKEAHASALIRGTSDLSLFYRPCNTKIFSRR